MAHFRKIVELSPGRVVPLNNLGVALATEGHFDEALGEFRKALQIQSDDVETHKNLAWLRATCPLAPLRNGSEAVEHALTRRPAL